MLKLKRILCKRRGIFLNNLNIVRFYHMSVSNNKLIGINFDINNVDLINKQKELILKGKYNCYIICETKENSVVDLVKFVKENICIYNDLIVSIDLNSLTIFIIYGSDLYYSLYSFLKKINLFYINAYPRTKVCFVNENDFKFILGLYIINDKYDNSYISIDKCLI